MKRHHIAALPLALAFCVWFSVNPNTAPTCRMNADTDWFLHVNSDGSGVDSPIGGKIDSVSPEGILVDNALWARITNQTKIYRLKGRTLRGFGNEGARITNQTKIYRLKGKERFRANFEDLKAGQEIVVLFMSDISTSYPPQVYADEIVIAEETRS
jgi:hypothetical protein